MTLVFTVAGGVLREALSRKWFLGLGVAIALLLGTLSLSLQLDVVNGALAGTRLFGKLVFTDIRAVDLALRPLFMGAAYLIFYGGNAFFLVACSDFAPAMLTPGRIEHLLSLPLRRWELLFGTYLGVMVLAVCAAVYGAGGLVLILGFKTGVWTARPLLAAVLGTGSFGAIYAAMMLGAMVLRSAALSAACGAAIFFGGIIAGNRDLIAPAFEEGPSRSLFRAITSLLPRIATLGKFSAEVAGSRPVEPRAVAALLGATGVFALGLLSLAAWHFEKKDF